MAWPEIATTGVIRILETCFNVKAGPTMFYLLCFGVAKRKAIKW